MFVSTITKNLSCGRGQNTSISGCCNLKVSAVSDHELDTPLLDEEEDDEGVDDDIEIHILNEICSDKDDIEDYSDDYIAEEAYWSNIFLYSREKLNESINKFELHH